MDDEGDLTSGHERQDQERQRRATEQRQREFAAARSHQEAKDANELGKTLCQVLILANGGVVTALLAYTGTQHPGLDFHPVAVRIALLLFCCALVRSSLPFLRVACSTPWP
jgi:hypothetical protein